jgi:hypothetical protein
MAPCVRVHFAVSEKFHDRSALDVEAVCQYRVCSDVNLERKVTMQVSTREHKMEVSDERFYSSQLKVACLVIFKRRFFSAWLFTTKR